MDLSHSKVQSLEKILSIVADLKAQGKRIVTTNGCFDILHPGHIETFIWAKKQGDVLVVGINSDASVRALKGDRRPIIAHHDRAHVVAELSAVDYVYLFEEESPFDALARIQPHVQVKGVGSEAHPAFLREKKLIESYGGVVLLAPAMDGRSTTTIIERILSLYR